MAIRSKPRPKAHPKRSGTFALSSVFCWTTTATQDLKPFTSEPHLNFVRWRREGEEGWNPSNAQWISGRASLLCGLEGVTFAEEFKDKTVEGSFQVSDCERCLPRIVVRLVSTGLGQSDQILDLKVGFGELGLHLDAFLFDLSTLCIVFVLEDTCSLHLMEDR